MIKRLLVTVGLILAATTVLTSCMTCKPKLEKQKKAAITFLHGWTEEPKRLSYLADLKAMFEERNPEISVTLHGVDVFEVGNTLMSAISSGNPPDIVLYGSGITHLVELGIPLDLRPWMLARDEAWMNTFVPGTKQFITHLDGGIYVAPMTLDAVPMNYHKDAVAKTGIPLPSTKAEFYALLDKLKQLGHTPPFELHKSMMDEMTDILVLDYASRDGISPKDIVLGNVPFNSRFVVDALDNFREMYVKGYFPQDCYTLGGSDGRKQYSSGVMATKMGYFGDVYVHHEYGMSYENQGVHPFPIMSGAQKKWRPGIVGGCFVVGETKHPEACIKFLKFLTSKEMQKRLVEVRGTKEIGYPLANRFVAEMSDYAASYATDLEHHTSYTFCNFNPEMTDILVENVPDLVHGRISPEELAEKFEALRKRVLAERKNK